jgi:predicted nucleotidyltransferase
MNRDFFDMLSALSEAGAEFMIVGAYALAVHARPRATGDIDIWVNPAPANAERVMRALVAFGAPLHDLTTADLTRPDTVFQIGVDPCRIDILSGVSGLRFEEAWTRRVELEIEGAMVPVLGREDLIANKRASNRAKDRLDLEHLGE